jgi:poly-gamma-glutamate synthesis protein (capsule biosynthesis protein)
MAVTRFALTGDVMLGRGVAEALASGEIAHPWGDVLPVLQSQEAVLVNLECALTRETERWRNGEEKAFYFAADPSAAEVLRLARVRFAALANNHAGDFGAKGLIETVATLDRAGIAHAGAGADLAAASAPARFELGGLRFAVVAFSDHPIAWAVSNSFPGIHFFSPSDSAEYFRPVERALAEARRGADFVVFSSHWGPNMRLRPPAHFRRFARRVLDSGADLFWGHSAHVVQGIELWQGKPILYDTGDFVDDYAVDEELRNDLSALFLLELEDGAVRRLELLPVQIRRQQVWLARGSERALFVKRMVELCAELGSQLDERAEPGSLSVRLERGGTP